MKSPVPPPLIEKSRALLSAIQSGDQDHRLAELLDDRSTEIRGLSEPCRPGGGFSAAERAEIERLDRELMAALSNRREQIGAELAALHRGRHAGLAYQSRPVGAPRFVDRAS